MSNLVVGQRRQPVRHGGEHVGLDEGQLQVNLNKNKQIQQINNVNKLSIGELGRPSLPPIPSLRTNYALEWGEDPPRPPLDARGANFVPIMGGGSPQTPLLAPRDGQFCP